MDTALKVRGKAPMNSGTVDALTKKTKELQIMKCRLRILRMRSNEV